MEDIVGYWLLLAAVFLIGELFIRTFYLFGPTLGGLIAGITSHLEFPFWSQWAIFFFVSIIFIVFTREIKKSMK